jgi:hypothetical protein
MDSLCRPSSLSFRQSLITEINADAQHPRPGRSPAPSTSHQTTPIEPGYITSVTSSSITGRWFITSLFMLSFMHAELR